MRTSLIVLFALAASPLLVFAAPASDISSLAERGISPLDGDFLEKLDTLSPDEIIDHIKNLTDDKAKDLVGNLTDEQFTKIIEKVGKDNKVLAIINKLRSS
ncbi:hypothetical protein K501DRAFT_286183 [Backusella circina FSU 941]|nr:hypothetical protein K501DRAFT_286183 [Backusella circina FSU 941]